MKNLLKSAKGFSLAELLIYLGILGLSAGVFSGILTTVTETQVDEFAENEISGQLTFSIQTIQRLIKSSSVIQNPAGTASSSLVLLLPDPSLNPTRIYVENKKIYIKQGNNVPQALTNEQVSVDSLEFKKFTQPGSKDVVHFDLAISQIEPSSGEIISHSLNSAVSRVSAASFDDSLIPNADATYNIGSASYRWKDGFFSGDVSAGNFCLGGTCKSTWGQVAGVTGSGTGGRVARWTAADTLGNSALYDTGSTIGIGVISPSLAFEVNGAGSFTSGIGAGTATLDSNYKITTSGGGIKAENNNATTPAGYFDNSGTGPDIQVSGGGIKFGDGTTLTSGSGTSQWTTSGSTIYYNAGNVGIGASVPGAKLELSGTSLGQLHITNSSSGGTTWRIGVSDNGWSSGGGKLLFGLTSTASEAKMALDNSGNVSINTTAADANYKLTISGGGIKSESTSQPAGYFNSSSGYGLLVNTGNVGIGTLTPSHKLDISGSYYSRLISKGSCSGSVSINWNDGNTQHCTLTGNVTFTFSNGASGGNYRLILKQGGAGNYSVTWPAAVRWAGGASQVPTLTGNVGRSDYVGFFYNGVDSTYDGVAFTANVY